MATSHSEYAGSQKSQKRIEHLDYKDSANFASVVTNVSSSRAEKSKYRLYTAELPRIREILQQAIELAPLNCETALTTTKSKSTVPTADSAVTTPKLATAKKSIKIRNRKSRITQKLKRKMSRSRGNIILAARSQSQRQSKLPTLFTLNNSSDNKSVSDTPREVYQITNEQPLEIITIQENIPSSNDANKQSKNQEKNLVFLQQSLSPSSPVAHAPADVIGEQQHDSTPPYNEQDRSVSKD